MRKAFDKIVELYKTKPIYQDLVETTLGTGVATAGQAMLTDMTPEELALAATVTFGAGMAGRPVGGAVGGFIGRQLNNRFGHKITPERQEILRRLGMQYEEKFPQMTEVVKAKFAPYLNQGMSIPEAYGNFVGRNRGDNVAQLLAALAMPQLYSDGENKEEII